MTRRSVLLILTLLAASLARAQGTITLRPVARLSIGEPITLKDVATLSGEAQQLAQAILMDNPTPAAGADRTLTFSMDDLRRSLRAQHHVLTSRLRLTGRACTVILRPAPSKTTSRAPSEPTKIEPDTAGLVVQDHIEAKLIETLGVPRDRLELTYNDRDRPLLRTPTAGWTVDVQPTGSSAKLPLRITMYDPAGGIRDESIRVGVRILRDVVRTTRALDRGSTLTDADLIPDTAWLAPDLSYVEPGRAAGLRLKRNVGAGELLTAGRVELGRVVKKGDIVAVHVISGGIVIRTPARALGSGRIGEQIAFEALKGEGTFTAEIKAPGRAVLIADRPAPAGEDQ